MDPSPNNNQYFQPPPLPYFNIPAPNLSNILPPNLTNMPPPNLINAPPPNINQNLPPAPPNFINNFPVPHFTPFVPPPNLSTNTDPSSPFSRPPPKHKKISDVDFIHQTAMATLHNFNNSHNEKKCRKTLNITTIKPLIRRMHTLITEVEQTHALLEAAKQTMSESDWNEKVEEIDQKMKKMSEISSSCDGDWFEQVALSILKKKKKRQRIKQKNQEWQEMKKRRLEFQLQEHKRIDTWLEKMKLEAERIQREENVKKEADSVLSDVTHKKTEAKRMLTLLNNLTKLRNARVQQKNSAGKYVSIEENNSFTEIIEKLKGLWVDQLKEYNEEEHGLRVMLDEAEVERKNIELAELKKNLQNWNIVFFGQKTEKLPSFLQRDSFEDFVYTRSLWDQYVVHNEAVMASSIPVGWIKPSPPSNAQWAKYLESDK